METKLAKQGKAQKVETEKWSARAPCHVPGFARAPEGLGCCPCVQSLIMVKARQPRRYSACGRRYMLYCGPVLGVLRACACSACLACCVLVSCPRCCTASAPARQRARGTCETRGRKEEENKTRCCMCVYAHVLRVRMYVGSHLDS